MARWILLLVALSAVAGVVESRPGPSIQTAATSSSGRSLASTIWNGSSNDGTSSSGRTVLTSLTTDNVSATDHIAALHTAQPAGTAGPDMPQNSPGSSTAFIAAPAITGVLTSPAAAAAEPMAVAGSSAPQAPSSPPQLAAAAATGDGRARRDKGMRPQTAERGMRPKTADGGMRPKTADGLCVSVSVYKDRQACFNNFVISQQVSAAGGDLTGTCSPAGATPRELQTCINRWVMAEQTAAGQPSCIAVDFQKRQACINRWIQQRQQQQQQAQATAVAGTSSVAAGTVPLPTNAASLPTILPPMVVPAPIAGGGLQQQPPL